jgi:hypothetical protein
LTSPALAAEGFTGEPSGDGAAEPCSLPKGSRPAEWLASGYLALTGALMLVARPAQLWWPALALHALSLYVILRVLPASPDYGWRGALRAFAPVLMVPLIYLELRLLTRLLSPDFFDPQLRVVELALFPSDPSRTLYGQLPWKALGEYLMASYVAYYLLLPILAIALYRARRDLELAYCLTTVLAVYLFCYLCFIVFPVAGPFFVFDPPPSERIGWLFPQIAQYVVSRGASAGATFPSSHVAAAVAMWLLARRFVRPLLVPFSIILPGLVLGAVYGGFHYAVDAGAGLVVGLIGYLLGPALWRALDGPSLPVRATASASGRR